MVNNTSIAFSSEFPHYDGISQHLESRCITHMVIHRVCRPDYMQVTKTLKKAFD